MGSRDARKELVGKPATYGNFCLLGNAETVGLLTDDEAHLANQLTGDGRVWLLWTVKLQARSVTRATFVYTPTFEARLLRSASIFSRRSSIIADFSVIAANLDDSFLLLSISVRCSTIRLATISI